MGACANGTGAAEALARRAADYLVSSGACPSIAYRVRREVLGEPRSSDEMARLQEMILQDGHVRRIIASRQPDGWLGTGFHNDGGAEAAIRLLREKGVEPSHPAITGALDAMGGEDGGFARELSRIGGILDERGLGGSRLIRAVVFAYAGAEDRELVARHVEVALGAFQAVLGVRSVSDVTETCRGKLVFRPGVRWPSIYDLRLLAFTTAWRSSSNRDTVCRAVERLVRLSPIPYVLVRHKSQLVAPPAVFMGDFNPDMSALDAAGWMMWFHRTEMLSRLGVVRAVPDLSAQLDHLCEMLEGEGGRFLENLSHPYFTHWGPYMGLALEHDWRSPERRVHDLTFRSLLILHYAGLIDAPSGTA